jgi:microcystin-dependent protein
MSNNNKYGSQKTMVLYKNDKNDEIDNNNKYESQKKLVINKNDDDENDENDENDNNNKYESQKKSVINKNDENVPFISNTTSSKPSHKISCFIVFAVILSVISIALSTFTLIKSIQQTPLDNLITQINNLTNNQVIIQKQINNLINNQVVIQNQINNLTNNQVVIQNLTDNQVIMQNQIKNLTGNQFVMQNQINNLTRNQDSLNIQINSVQLQIEMLQNSSIPVGTISVYGLISPPVGWLNCNGSLVSRTQYVSLFSVIGTTYGSGDGINTFGLPDLRGRTIIGIGTGNNLTPRNLGEKGGEENHILTLAEIPSHNHPGSFITPGGFVGIGVHDGGAYYFKNSGNTAVNVASQGGGLGHNNMQPYIVLNYIIKVF